MRRSKDICSILFVHVRLGFKFEVFGHLISINKCLFVVVSVGIRLVMLKTSRWHLKSSGTQIGDEHSSRNTLLFLLINDGVFITFHKLYSLSSDL